MSDAASSRIQPRLKPIVVTGYHGTRKDVAEQILVDGFKASENSWEWLGHGIYLWQEALLRARDWARGWLARKNCYGPIAVVAARIFLRNCIDSAGPGAQPELLVCSSGCEKNTARTFFSTGWDAWRHSVR